MNALSLVVIMAVAAVVSSETCNSVSDCTHVTCDAAHAVNCVRGQCTCTDPIQTCTMANDCHGQCRRDWHCVDGACHCGFDMFPGGGK